MTPRYPLFVALAGIAAGLCLSRLRADAAAISSAPSGAAAALTALEASMPKDRTDDALILANQERVIALIDGNTLQTGEDFLRAGSLLAYNKGEHRIVRIRYELLLAAAAKGSASAEKALASAYDSLMDRIGRPQRFDFSGWAQTQPEWTEYEAAPACIVTVWRDPGTARAAAGIDNAEVKTLVDADQADRRGNWQARSEVERDATVKRDLARNARIREIVAAGDLHTANDFARASLVLQHSARFGGFRLAHELAVASLLLGDRGLGRWLIAATYDRMLRSCGLDQRFGTQYGADGPITVDEKGICDNERLALGCPSLAEAGNRARKPPTKTTVVTIQPTLTSVDNRLEDNANRVSATHPESWKLIRATQVDAHATSARFAIANHSTADAVFYYRMEPLPIPAGNEEAALRLQAAAKETDRRHSIPDYRNNTDSIEFHQTSDRAYLRWTASFTRENEAWSESLIRIAGRHSQALLFIQAPVAEIGLLRSDLDAFAGTVKLP